MSIEDHYYNKEEYFKLTPVQKNSLQLKRKKRGHVTNKNQKKSAKSQINSGKFLTAKQAKALIAAILQQGDTSQDETNDAGTLLLAQRLKVRGQQGRRSDMQKEAIKSTKHCRGREGTQSDWWQLWHSWQQWKPGGLDHWPQIKDQKDVLNWTVMQTPV